MPTLSEVLALANATVCYEIELRTPDLKFLHAVLDLITIMKLQDRVELTSPHLPLLFHATVRHPEIRTGVFFSPLPDWMQPPQRQQLIISWLQLTGARVAHLPVALLDNAIVARLHEQGRLAHGADLNSPAEIRSAFSMQIDQISTDELDLALSLRPEPRAS